MEPRQIKKELDKVLKDISKREKEKGKLSTQLNKIGMELVSLYSAKNRLENRLRQP